MTEVFKFVAETRANSGTTAANGLRRKGNVPAILYGGHDVPKMLVLNHNEVIKHLAHEAVYSHVLDISVDGKTEQAILKAVQRNPAKFQVLHLDFQRVSMSEEVKVHVPLHFINENTSVGGKKGGIAAHSLNDIEVSCLPGALPEYIAVDLIKLDIGETIHLSDIELPAGVKIVALAQGIEHDLPVVSMMASRASKEESDT